LENHVMNPFNPKTLKFKECMYSYIQLQSIQLQVSIIMHCHTVRWNTVYSHPQKDREINVATKTACQSIRTANLSLVQ
jgi:hypothetical protein